jgi:F-type H+-transporting ATPase subunit c
VKTRLSLLFGILCALAIPAFAQAPGATPGAESPWNLRPVAAVIGMAIASGLCGLAQGRAVSSASEAMARNPAASAAIRFALILGLVLIESLALYTLVIVFLRT